jgi:hypothetical protein
MSLHYHVTSYFLVNWHFDFLLLSSFIGSGLLFASDGLLNGYLLFILTENMTPEQRRENYGCDITYITNSELGFDYLRDNLAMVCIFLSWKLLYYYLLSIV